MNSRYCFVVAIWFFFCSACLPSAYSIEIDIASAIYTILRFISIKWDSFQANKFYLFLFAMNINEWIWLCSGSCNFRWFSPFISIIFIFFNNAETKWNVQKIWERKIEKNIYSTLLSNFDVYAPRAKENKNKKKINIEWWRKMRKYFSSRERYTIFSLHLLLFCGESRKL